MVQGDNLIREGGYRATRILRYRGDIVMFTALCCGGGWPKLKWNKQPRSLSRVYATDPKFFCRFSSRQ